MLKKVLVILIMTAIITGSSNLQAQDKTDYSMWESFYVTPDNTKLKALGEAMAKHNKKYHAEGPYKASVYNVVTGPNMGKLIWQMGPLNYSHLDSRPSDGGHDEDWRDNVMPNIKKLSSGEYWKQDDKLSNIGALQESDTPYPILHIRFFEVKRRNGHQVDHLLKQISETVKAMDGDNPWGVYDNQFRQGYAIGRHLATVGFSKNWAEYDEKNTFKETFLKVNGENSWPDFIDGMGDAFSDSWDEVWELNNTLSGN